MEIIAIINQKGGVGKSTTALALGAGLTLRGYRVLFVDLDAQGNLTYALGAESRGVTVMELLQQVNRPEEAIQQTNSGDLIASSPALSGADALIVATGKEYRLKEALEPLRGIYDYCILDTPPALGILTVNALTACKGAIIPAQADIFSLQAIGNLSDTIETVRRYCNPELHIMGIVLTRYAARTIISREVADVMEKVATGLNTKLYRTKIREATALKESQATRMSIFEYAPRSNASADYNDLIDEIIGGN
jgi:chromosome partitioning protein